MVIIILSTWGLISTVTAFIIGMNTIFDYSAKSYIDECRNILVLAIKNRKKLSLVGKIIIVPIYTIVAMVVLAPIIVFPYGALAVLTGIFTVLHLIFCARE